MKRLFSTVLLIVCTFGISAQNISFKINSGTDNALVKSSVETNVSALLSAINKAWNEDNLIDYSRIRITEEARQSLSMLWDNIHFYCTDQYVVERLLNTPDGEYQVRGIPMLLAPESDDFDDDTYQEATVNLDGSGKIISFYFSLKSNLYREVISKGTDVEDLRLRQTILDYVEHFRTAYNQKDIHFLEQVFSDDALIITGKVVKVHHSDVNLFDQNKVTYNVQSKQQYLSRLKTVFQNAKYIKVDFSEIKISRHPTNENFYGVLVRQGYDSGSYSDDGYVFLLWDFSDELRPQIHVRTWQPYWMNDEQTVTLPEKDIITINNFNL